MCLNFQLDQSPHKGGAFLPPPGPGIESQTPVQIGLNRNLPLQPKPNPIYFAGDPHRVGEDGARGGQVPGVDNAGAPATERRAAPDN